MITVDLRTIGARSGRERRVRLYAVHDSDALAVIGSSGGDPVHPAWVHNLRANPRIRVIRGKREYEAVAREVEGAERERIWQALREGFPLYERYRQRTDRRFPIFRLEEVEAG